MRLGEDGRRGVEYKHTHNIHTHTVHTEMATNTKDWTEWVSMWFYNDVFYRCVMRELCVEAIIMTK